MARGGRNSLATITASSANNTHHGARAAVVFYCAQLFLAVLLGMSLHCLFSMPSAMNYVASRSVSVVCRLFMMSSIVVLGGLLVVTGGMLKMF
jgi:hypothetical protein